MHQPSQLRLFSTIKTQYGMKTSQLVHSSQLRLFSTIKTQYGMKTSQLVHSYTRTVCKLARRKEQLTFNIRCKHMKLIPPSLVVKPLVKTPEGYMRSLRKPATGF